MGTIQFNDSVVLFGDSAAANTDKVAFHADCCCGVWDECEICDGDAPLEWSVTLAGITDQDCNECDPDLNDTFIFGWSDAQASFCYWSYGFSPNLCIAGDVITNLALFVDHPGGNGRVRVVVEQAGGRLHQWQKSWSGVYVPCNTLVDEDIPHESDTSDNCNSVGSTCTITAL